MKYRTHTCGQLTAADTGAKVVLSGWVETIRDHGGVLFVDLRDHYGVTQIVVHDDAMLREVSKETVIMVAGEVSLRDEETVNPKLATGHVEVVADKIDILGKCTEMLPFEIQNTANVREDVRLKYRYLDLRNAANHERIMFRSRVISFLRAKMESLGFTEIQTPILTASSPEGARDFLVPSRKYKGKFYALPQAPQQFKQLLMVSGFDRYYQIAPCFRDEDARQDRSPGEFYQLDYEMAFADQEDVLEVAEEVVYDLFAKFSTKKVSPRPFKRIPYREAMAKYGSDKPDLRNPLVICDLTEFFKGVDFPIFKGRPVRGIVADCTGKSRAFFDKSLAFAQDIGLGGLGYLTLKQGEYKGPIAKFLNDAQQQQLRDLTGIKEGETVFFVCAGAKVVDGLSGQIRTWLGKELELIDNDAIEFCFVVDFPMYTYNNEEKKIDFMHNPFSMPQGGMKALEGDPLEALAYQYDLVCNGVEVSSGAVRNHDPEIMRKAFAIAGYSEDELKAKFSALYTAFSYGAPPHAGMAPGVERLLMLLTDATSIREVMAFPLNSSAQDAMVGAPSGVTEQQLREVHIKVRD